jgi:translation initiation factor 6
VPVGRGLFGGSPYLGVYLRVGENIGFAPPTLPNPLARDLERLLGIRIVRTNAFDCEVVGAMVAANSNGIVVGDEIDREARRFLEEVAAVTVIRHRQNAMGNNILANDSGAIVHPEFSNEAVHQLARALNVPVERGTVAGLGTVGMAGVATNRGVVLHPKATDHEVAAVGSRLGVPVHRSTANFGVPIVGACVVANSRGFVVGRPTTPVEIVHLQDGFGVYS